MTTFVVCELQLATIKEHNVTSVQIWFQNLWRADGIHEVFL